MSLFTAYAIITKYALKAGEENDSRRLGKLNLVLGAFRFQMLPQISLFFVSNESNLFFQGILLTVSSP
ncbi:hypothetical protein A7X67_13860 [Clostridium sp. W14A]|nr:hypothetical protein A7X67_13860 [Clostridium sp. W14A]